MTLNSLIEKSDSDKAEYYINEMICYMRQGNYIDSTEILKKRRGLFQKLGYCLIYAKFCAVSGELFLRKGVFHKAVRYFEHGIDVMDNVGEKSSFKSRILCNLAFCELLAGHYSKARNMLKSAVNIALKNKDYNLLLYCFELSGILEIMSSNNNKANYYFKKAFDLIKNKPISDTEKIITLHLSASLYYFLTNKLSTGLDLTKQAALIYKKSKIQHLEIEQLFQLNIIYSLLGESNYSKLKANILNFIDKMNASDSFLYGKLNFILADIYQLENDLVNWEKSLSKAADIAFFNGYVFGEDIKYIHTLLKGSFYDDPILYYSVNRLKYIGLKKIIKIIKSNYNMINNYKSSSLVKLSSGYGNLIITEQLYKELLPTCKNKIVDFINGQIIDKNGIKKRITRDMRVIVPMLSYLINRKNNPPEFKEIFTNVWGNCFTGSSSVNSIKMAASRLRKLFDDENIVIIDNTKENTVLKFGGDKNWVFIEKYNG